MPDVQCFWLVDSRNGRDAIEQHDKPDWQQIVGFTCDFDAVIAWVNEGKLPYVEQPVA